jgi:hypothetical protein
MTMGMPRILTFLPPSLVIWMAFMGVEEKNWAIAAQIL